MDNNNTVWVVMYTNSGRVEMRGVFRTYDSAEEFVVANSYGALVKSDVTGSLYVCTYHDGIHHMTSSFYTIVESPVR